jgi:4-amino-4-deoxy-L-arabinose transferase-like glycosyltransferase
MQLDFTSKLKKLTRNWIFWLIVITGIAVVIRSIPAWTNAAWGCDFGIYYGLTNSLVKTGDLFNPYTGWGSSYQYFPVLYAVTGIGHWITGIDTLTLMSKIAPIFGGLSVLIFYFVVYELIGDRKIAILSSLFLAVLPFHVYQTSHAAPLTMGHFFMMLSLYLFIKYRQDARYLVYFYHFADNVSSSNNLFLSHISDIHSIFRECRHKRMDNAREKRCFVYPLNKWTGVFLLGFYCNSRL